MSFRCLHWLQPRLDRLSKSRIPISNTPGRNAKRTRAIRCTHSSPNVVSASQPTQQMTRRRTLQLRGPSEILRCKNNNHSSRPRLTTQPGNEIHCPIRNPLIEEVALDAAVVNPRTASQLHDYAIPQLHERHFVHTRHSFFQPSFRKV